MNKRECVKIKRMYSWFWGVFFATRRAHVDAYRKSVASRARWLFCAASPWKSLNFSERQLHIRCGGTCHSSPCQLRKWGRRLFWLCASKNVTVWVFFLFEWLFPVLFPCKVRPPVSRCVTSCLCLVFPPLWLSRVVSPAPDEPFLCIWVLVFPPLFVSSCCYSFFFRNDKDPKRETRVNT